MIVYGKNVAREVINSKKKINKVYLSNNFNDQEILKIIKKYEIKYMSQKDLDKITSKNHQGIILDIEDYNYNQLESVLNKSFLVILDHLEDPQNFGAIIRTCEAAGVDAIIIPNKRSVEVNSTVMKVSAGALNNISIVRESNLVNTMEKLKKHGFWIYGTDMNGGTDFYDVKYDSKTVLVIGSEGSGMSKLVKENCDFIINIPMQGKINSLNASVAAAISIYEVVKQRKCEK